MIEMLRARTSQKPASRSDRTDVAGGFNPWFRDKIRIRREATVQGDSASIRLSGRYATQRPRATSPGVETPGYDDRSLRDGLVAEDVEVLWPDPASRSDGLIEAEVEAEVEAKVEAEDVELSSPEPASRSDGLIVAGGFNPRFWEKIGIRREATVQGDSASIRLSGRYATKRPRATSPGVETPGYDDQSLRDGLAAEDVEVLWPDPASRSDGLIVAGGFNPRFWEKIGIRREATVQGDSASIRLSGRYATQRRRATSPGVETPGYDDQSLRDGLAAEDVELSSPEPASRSDDLIVVGGFNPRFRDKIRIRREATVQGDSASIRLTQRPRATSPGVETTGYDDRSLRDRFEIALGGRFQ